MTNHQKYMRIALEYAERGLGANPHPNPSVGCVIVKNGRIIAAAHTASGGRPHAEVAAINSAIEPVTGATAYVTLEPCSHFGKSPPCADAIINSGIAEVFIACVDPNPLVAGAGIKKLQEAGIKVKVGILEAEAKKLHKPFFKLITTGMPYTTLKMAVSADNKIGIRGEKLAISGERANNYVQHLRLKSEAILVGIDTVLNDNPMLNCRLQGLEQNSPVRIILDSNLKIDKACNIIKTANEIETIIFTAKTGVEKLGAAEIFVVDKNADGHLNLEQVLKKLGELGFNSILVEGGAKVAETLLQQGFVDCLQIIFAPKILGEEAVEGIDLESDFIKNNFKLSEQKTLGNDVLKVFDCVIPWLDHGIQL